MYNGINIGDRLSNSDIKDNFGGRNMGGLRYSAVNHLLIIINNGDVEFFPDQHITVDDEEIIIYFGEGNYGDQSISGGNWSLYYSKDTRTPLHYFIKNSYDKKYTYNGRVELINETPLNKEFHTDDGRLIAKLGNDGIPNLLGDFTHEEAFKAIRGPYRAHRYERFNKWYLYRDLNNEPRSVIIFPLRKLEG